MLFLAYHSFLAERMMSSFVRTPFIGRPFCTEMETDEYSGSLEVYLITDRIVGGPLERSLLIASSPAFK